MVFKQKKKKQKNRKNVGRDIATTVANYSGPGSVLKRKQEILKNTAIQEKLQLNIQQVTGRDKGRALLHFKQIDLKERGSSQS